MPQRGDDPVKPAEAFGLGGCAAPNNNDGGSSPARQSPDGLATFSYGSGGDRAGVDHGEVGLVVGARRLEVKRFEQLSNLLRLVLIDFTAKRGELILASHRRTMYPRGGGRERSVRARGGGARRGLAITR